MIFEIKPTTSFKPFFEFLRYYKVIKKKLVAKKGLNILMIPLHEKHLLENYLVGKTHYNVSKSIDLVRTNDHKQNSKINAKFSIFLRRK